MNFTERLASLEQVGKKSINLIPILATTSLTLLVGLMPEDKPGYPENYWLAATWILLCVSIPLALFSVHLYSTSNERHLLNAMMDIGNAPQGQKVIQASEATKRNYKVNKMSLGVLTASLLLFYSAFVCLTFYACYSIF